MQTRSESSLRKKNRKFQLIMRLSLHFIAFMAEINKIAAKKKIQGIHLNNLSEPPFN